MNDKCPTDSSVGDHRPVGHDRSEVAIECIFWSWPEVARDPEIFLGRDLEIFRKIYPYIKFDESNIKCSTGSRPEFRSLLDIFCGSRPILGCDPGNILGRDLDSGSRSPTLTDGLTGSNLIKSVPEEILLNFLWYSVAFL